MSSVALLSGIGIRSRRRGGLIATFVVLVFAAIGITAGLAVSRQGAPLLDDVAETADRKLRLRNGRIEQPTRAAAPRSA